MKDELHVFDTIGSFVDILIHVIDENNQIKPWAALTVGLWSGWGNNLLHIQGVSQDMHLSLDHYVWYFASYVFLIVF